MTESLLITGTSTGLGLEWAVHLAEKGYKVYATMRDTNSRGLLEQTAVKRNENIEMLRMDITDQETICSDDGTFV